jgi:hypothetical protein
MDPSPSALFLRDAGSPSAGDSLTGRLQRTTVQNTRPEKRVDDAAHPAVFQRENLPKLGTNPYESQEENTRQTDVIRISIGHAPSSI